MKILQKYCGTSSQGFALPMTMAVLGFSGLMIYGMMQVTQNRAVAKRIAEVSQKRQQLVNNTRQSTSNGTTLLTSAFQAGNDKLSRCVRGIGAGACNDNAERQFEAYAPIGAGNAPIKLSGSPGKPVAYDLNGQLCTCGSSSCLSTRCPFYLETFFRAQCANGAPTCNAGAYSIELRSQLTHDAGYPLPAVYGGKKFGVLPNNTSLYLSSVDVADVYQDIHVTCNPNSNLTGYNSTGGIICQCRSNFTQTGTDPNNGHPICTAANQNCPTTHVFLGIDATGKAICQPPDYSGVSCTTLTGQKSGIKTSCGSAGRRVRGLSNYNGPACYTYFSPKTPTGGKPDRGQTFPGFARCDNIEVICCDAS